MSDFHVFIGMLRRAGITFMVEDDPPGGRPGTHVHVDIHGGIGGSPAARAIYWFDGDGSLRLIFFDD